MTELQKRRADVREARLCLARARVELSRASCLLDRRTTRPDQLPEYYEVNRAFWAVDEVEKKVAKIRETGGSVPAAAADASTEQSQALGLERPVLNKSGGSDVEAPWPLCAARVGCLVRVEVAGSYCRKHGGAGPW